MSLAGPKLEDVPPTVDRAISLSFYNENVGKLFPHHLICAWVLLPHLPFSGPVPISSITRRKDGRVPGVREEEASRLFGPTPLFPPLVSQTLFYICTRVISFPKKGVRTEYVWLGKSEWGPILKFNSGTWNSRKVDSLTFKLWGPLTPSKSWQPWAQVGKKRLRSQEHDWTLHLVHYWLKKGFKKLQTIEI